MESPNSKLLTPKNNKLTLFKRSVAVCTSAAIAAVFLQSLPPKMRSFAEAVTGETASGFTYSIEGEIVTITGWTGDKETVTSLTIPSEVKGQTVNAIGDNAFCDMPMLTSVSIPDSVTSIGWSAFQNSGLTSVTLPPGIQKLSCHVFMDCKDLKELTIPKDFPKDGMSFEDLYSGRFASLSDSCIETLIFEDGMEAIPDWCAYSIPTLNKLVIPDSVTTIGSNAFYNCDSLTEFDIPSGIKTIEAAAFASCDGFSGIVIPDGVEVIGQEAFGSSESMTSAVLPSSLKELGSHVFVGCKALNRVELQEGLETMGSSAFSGCENMKELTVPSTVTVADSVLEGSYIEKVILSDGMTAIPDQLCGSSQHLTELVIPDSVTSLGTSLFNGTTSIREFTIPSQITSGKSVFEKSSLEAVHFEPGFSRIPDSFFSSAVSLADIDWTSDITEIGDSAFWECSALRSAEIPDTVTSIGNSAFAHCSAMTRISFPDGITDIPEFAAAYCTSLNEAELPDGLTSIGPKAFQGCSALSSIALPDTLTDIGEWAFASCASLKGLDLPSALSGIGSYAFAECSSLREITLPKTLTTVGASAFDCGLREVWFEEGMERIPAYAVHDAKLLREAHIPASVTFIDEYAFGNCRELETLDMPFKAGELLPDVNFSQYTFLGCDSLYDERVIPYEANGTFVNCMKSASADSDLINYTIYYSLNPVFKDIFSSGKITVSTKEDDPIDVRSRPVGLTEEELESIYATSTSFTIPGNETTGIFRFSTRPKEGADTSVEVKLYASYSLDQLSYEKLIPVNNALKGNEPVSLTVPENTGINGGKAVFDVYGSAPVGEDVTVYLNGEAVASATPNQYTGRYHATVDTAADLGDTLELYAQSGEKSSSTEKVKCTNSTVSVEKVIFTHNNAHTEYSIDITGAFKYGQKPYLAINPSEPLGFEVTLSDNDCESVSVASTTNGNTSLIDLQFSEETGTWKGEGFFDTQVPGTMNILAVPRSMDITYVVGTDENNNYTFSTENGKMIFSSVITGDAEESIKAFLDENPMEIVTNENDVMAVRFVPKYANAANVTSAPPPDLVPFSRYAAIKDSNAQFTEIPSLNVVNAMTDVLTIDGTKYTGNDAIAADTFKLEKMPVKIQNPDGTFSEVYIMTLGESEQGLIDKLAVNFKVGLENAKEFLESGLDKTKEGCITVYRNIETGVSEFCLQIRTSFNDYIFNAAGDTAIAIIQPILEQGFANGFTTLLTTVYTPLSTFGDIYLKINNLEDIINHLEAVKDPKFQEQISSLKSNIYINFITQLLFSSIIVGAGAVTAYAGIVGALPTLASIFLGLSTGCCWWLIKCIYDSKEAFIRKQAYSISNDANVNSLIDPSGIAYEWLPSNPVEGATAEIYYQDSEGKAVLWNAEDYDQVNPQITDSAGWFAWDVPEGMWQVRVSVEGYDDAESEWLPVLPVQTGVNIKLTSKQPAEISDAGYGDSKAVVKFSKHMLDSTVTAKNLVITDKNGKTIDCDITPVKEEGNDTDASMTFILTPKAETALAGAKVGVKTGAQSYAGVACKESKMIALRELSEEEMPQQSQTADYLLGDVNEDGKIDAKDASAILAEYSIMSTGGDGNFTASQKQAADVNADTKIDAKDASSILSYYAMASTATDEVPSMEEFMKSKTA